MNSETWGLWRECLVAEQSGWDGYIYLPSLLDWAKALFAVGSDYVRERSILCHQQLPLR